MSTQGESVDGSAPGADEAKGAKRVIIRGVSSIVLDDLPDDVQRQLVELAERAGGRDWRPRETWEAVAARTGTYDASIKSYTGQSGSPDAKHGKFRAVPATNWYVTPLVIEPPLPLG